MRLTKNQFSYHKWGNRHHTYKGYFRTNKRQLLFEIHP